MKRFLKLLAELVMELTVLTVFIVLMTLWAHGVRHDHNIWAGVLAVGAYEMVKFWGRITQEDGYKAKCKRAAAELVVAAEKRSDAVVAATIKVVTTTTKIVEKCRARDVAREAA